MPKRRANGEGSIFKRKDGLWAAQYTDNAGKKRTLYGKTQQIVKEKLKEAIKQSDNGLVVDKNKITFAEWLLEWLEVYHKPTVRESTHVRADRRIKHHIIPAFPKVLLKDLRADMLQRFFNEKAVGSRFDGKEGGLSVSELYNMRQIISQALNQAIENNIILTNVADKVGNYAGIWYFASKNSVVQYNEVFNGGDSADDGRAFDVDWYNINNLVQYNYSHNNYRGFAMFPVNSTGTVFRYNVSVNDCMTNIVQPIVYHAESSDFAPLIYNNFIYQYGNESVTKWSIGGYYSKRHLQTGKAMIK